MNPLHRHPQPQAPASGRPATAAPARRDPATWMIAAAVAGGVFVGVCATWAAMRPGRVPELSADGAEAGEEAVIKLGSSYEMPPSPGRSERARSAAAVSRREPKPAAESEPPKAPQVVVLGDDGDETQDPDSATDRGAESEPKPSATREAAQAAEVMRQQAFQDFMLLGKAVNLPAAAAVGGADLGDRPASRDGRAVALDLGECSWANLVEPGFRLALPRDTIDGKEFRAEVVKVARDGSDAAWEVRNLGPAQELGDDARRPLATLVARDGRLVLEVPKSNDPNLAPFALLRRCVILAEAKDPAAPEAPAVVQEIRLVEPTKVRPLVIDLFAEHRQELKIVPPPGIPRTVKAVDGSNPPLAIPIESLRLDAEFPRGQKVSYELPKDVEERSDPCIRTWKIPLAQLNPDLAIEADIQLSLPQATLAVETRLLGNKAGGLSKEKIKEFFIDEPDEKFKNLDRAFRARIKDGGALPLAQTRTPQGAKQILGWFEKALVDQSMSMPGHETVAKSFDLFLKQQYDEAAKNMKPGQLPGLPESFKDFFDDCQRVEKDTEWQSVFTRRVSDWAAWFWPKFRDQWEANVKLFQGSLAERHEIRITAITSLAYDETGKVYEVPLVVALSAGRPDPRSELEADQPLGFAEDRRTQAAGDPALPLPAAGGGGSVGLD
jgi:hypothetical protein